MKASKINSRNRRFLNKEDPVVVCGLETFGSCAPLPIECTGTFGRQYCILILCLRLGFLHCLPTSPTCDLALACSNSSLLGHCHSFQACSQNIESLLQLLLYNDNCIRSSVTHPTPRFDILMYMCLHLFFSESVVSNRGSKFKESRSFVEPILAFFIMKMGMSI